MFGDAVGEGVGLGDGEEWGAGADGFEDGRVDVAELRDGGGFAGLGAAYSGCAAGSGGGLGFEAGGVAGVLSCGGVGSEAGGDDDVVFFSGGEVFDFEAEAWAEVGELFVECGCDAGDGDAECAGAFVGGWLGDPDFFCLCGGRVRRRVRI